jgi:hypothetical protein
VQADNIFRALSHSGNGVNILIGGIAGENRSGLADFVELSKNLLLDLEIFKYCFGLF